MSGRPPPNHYGSEGGGRLWGARRCSLVGDTGSLPRGHWKALAVAYTQQDVVRDSLCRITAGTSQMTRGAAALSLCLWKLAAARAFLDSALVKGCSWHFAVTVSVGIWFCLVLEMDSVWAVHGKGTWRVCLSLSTFTDRLCRCELALSAHSSKLRGADPGPLSSPGPAALWLQVAPQLPSSLNPRALASGSFSQDVPLFANRGQPSKPFFFFFFFISGQGSTAGSAKSECSHGSDKQVQPRWKGQERGCLVLAPQLEGPLGNSSWPGGHQGHKGNSPVQGHQAGRTHQARAPPRVQLLALELSRAPGGNHCTPSLPAPPAPQSLQKFF